MLFLLDSFYLEKKLMGSYPKNSLQHFNRHIFQVFSGASLAYLIGFLLLPFVTRLYSPQVYGVFQVIYSCGTLFGAVAGLCYDSAILLPRSKKMVVNLTAVSLVALLLVSFSVCVFSFIFDAKIKDFLRIPQVHYFPFLIFFAVLSVGLLRISQSYMARYKMFKTLSFLRIISVLFTQGGLLILGLLNPTYFSLILSYVSFSILIYLGSILFFLDINYLKFGVMKKASKKYKKFPLINAPSVLINALSMELPIFLFSIFFGSSKVGLYLMAFRVLTIPMSLVGYPVSIVFYSKMAEIFKKSPEAFFASFNRVFRKIIFISASLYLPLAVFSPLFLGKILGGRWHLVGLIVLILSPGKFFEFINIIVSRVLNVIDRQNVVLILRVFSVFFRFTVIYFFRSNFIEACFALSVSLIFYYFSFTIIVRECVKRAKISFNW